jgi:hypothetical protein
MRIWDKLLSTPNTQITVSLLWFFQNLVADKRDIRNTFVTTQLYNKILDIVNPDDVYTPVAQNVATLISNIHKIEKDNIEPPNSVIEKSTKILCSIAKVNNPESQLETMWALANITTSENQNIPAIITQSGCLESLVTLIKHNMDHMAIKNVFVKIVGNFTSYKDNFIDYILTLDVLGVVVHFLNDSLVDIRRETLWLFSNISAGKKEHISYLLTNGYFDLFRLKLKDNFDVALEAVWCISNCISGSDLELKVRMIKNHQLFETLKDCLLINHEKIVLLAIESLYAVFDDYSSILYGDDHANKFVYEFAKIGGDDVLESLQATNSEKVKNALDKLLFDFFPLE